MMRHLDGEAAPQWMEHLCTDAAHCGASANRKYSAVCASLPYPDPRPGWTEDRIWDSSFLGSIPGQTPNIEYSADGHPLG
jgi:hypothetical protein